MWHIFLDIKYMRESVIKLVCVSSCVWFAVLEKARVPRRGARRAGKTEQKPVTSLSQAEGRVTQPDAPSTGKPSKLAHFPSALHLLGSPGWHGLCTVTWCPHCRTPRGLFPTRSVPVGGAASQLQAELITAITPPVGCATQSISESLNTQRDLT